MGKEGWLCPCFCLPNVLAFKESGEKKLATWQFFSVETYGHVAGHFGPIRKTLILAGLFLAEGGGFFVLYNDDS